MKIDINDALDDMMLDETEEQEVKKHVKVEEKAEKVDFNNEDFEHEPQKVEQVKDIDVNSTPTTRKRPTRKATVKKEKVESTENKQVEKTEVHETVKEEQVVEEPKQVENTVEQAVTNTEQVEQATEQVEKVVEPIKKEEKKPLTLKEKREKLKDTMEMREKETSSKEYVKDDNSYKKEVEHKKFNFVPFIIGGVALVIVLIIAVVAVKNLSKDKDKHITTVDLQQELAKVNAEYEESHKVDETVVEKPVEQVEENKEIIYKKSEDVKIDFAVNTKLENDTEYKDYETYLNVSFDNIYQGYSDVIPYITEYNKSSDTLVEIGDEETFYSNYYGNEIVLLEFNVDYDENIASASGKIYDIPSIDVSIIPTDEENNAIVIDGLAFNVPNIIPLNNLPTEIMVGDTVTYRYLVILPSKASKDSYNIDVNVSLKDINKEFKVEGQQINDLGIDYSQVETTEVSEEQSEVSEEQSEVEEGLEEVPLDEIKEQGLDKNPETTEENTEEKP